MPHLFIAAIRLQGVLRRVRALALLWWASTMASLSGGVAVALVTGHQNGLAPMGANLALHAAILWIAFTRSPYFVNFETVPGTNSRPPPR